jgi:hypothetical protein
VGFNLSKAGENQSSFSQKCTCVYLSTFCDAVCFSNVPPDEKKPAQFGKLSPFSREAATINRMRSCQRENFIQIERQQQFL